MSEKRHHSRLPVGILVGTAGLLFLLVFAESSNTGLPGNHIALRASSRRLLRSWESLINPILGYSQPGASPGPLACQVFEYFSAESDPEPFQHMTRGGLPLNGTKEARGHRFSRLRVWLNRKGRYAKFGVPQSCAEDLRRQGHPEPVFASDSDQFEFGVINDGLQQQQEQQEQQQQQQQQCALLSGTWFLLSERAGQRKHNLFEHLVSEWYPLWLAKQTLFGGRDPGARVTHLNGLRDGPANPFLPVYAVFGQYVQWQEVVAAAAAQGGEQGAGAGPGRPATATGVGGGPPCIDFEDAVVVGSGRLWMATPLATFHSAPLLGFADAVAAALGAADAEPDPCAPRALLAARDDPGGDKAWEKARYVANAGELLEAAREALPGFAVERVDLGALPLAQAVAAVRRVSVFAFPHGGAGPNVLWLRRGAAVLELFPHMSADPMYRNLAVLTGKVYLSWQAQAFLEQDPDLFAPGYQRGYGKSNYHFAPQSAFAVNATEVAALLRAAAWVARGNLGDSWDPANAARHTTALTPWSNETRPSC